MCMCTHTQGLYESFLLGLFRACISVVGSRYLAERPLVEPGPWDWALHSAVEMDAGINDASG